MTHRATITLDEEAYAFLMSAARENRSGFINELLIREKERALDAALAKANEEEAQDAVYQEELRHWDGTIADGL